MRRDVFAKACCHQSVAPVVLRCCNFAFQPTQVTSRELQHCKSNAIEPGRLPSHPPRQWQVCATLLLNQLSSRLSALWCEQSVDSLTNSFAERCHGSDLTQKTSDNDNLSGAGKTALQNKFEAFSQNLANPG